MKIFGKNRFLAPAPRLAPAGAGASAPAPVLGTSLLMGDWYLPETERGMMGKRRNRNVE